MLSLTPVQSAERIVLVNALRGIAIIRLPSTDLLQQATQPVLHILHRGR